jgi:PII-like signaling protein
MKRELQTATKLTVFIGSDERRAHRPLYEAVLAMLRAGGVTGATITKGVMGFGSRRRIHSNMNEIAMENLPLIIEAIDENEKLRIVASQIAEMLGTHGLVQLQRTNVCKLPSAEDERSAG